MVEKTHEFGAPSNTHSSATKQLNFIDILANGSMGKNHKNFQKVIICWRICHSSNVKRPFVWWWVGFRWVGGLIQGGRFALLPSMGNNHGERFSTRSRFVQFDLTDALFGNYYW